MAELLVKAHESNYIAPQSLAADELARFAGRRQKGDIITVKPDGWKWGKRECPPRYIIVKLPGVSVTDATEYMTALYDKDGNTVKIRKYALSEVYVEEVKNNLSGVASVSKVSLDNMVINKDK